MRCCPDRMRLKFPAAYGMSTQRHMKCIQYECTIRVSFHTRLSFLLLLLLFVFRSCTHTHTLFRSLSFRSISMAMNARVEIHKHVACFGKFKTPKPRTVCPLHLPECSPHKCASNGAAHSDATEFDEFLAIAWYFRSFCFPLFFFHIICVQLSFILVGSLYFICFETFRAISRFILHFKERTSREKKRIWKSACFLFGIEICLWNSWKERVCFFLLVSHTCSLCIIHSMILMLLLMMLV